MNIRTYNRFYDPIEANIVASRLKENGIECFLTNEYTTNVLWYINVAHGGVSLMMDVNDFAKADEILHEEVELELENDGSQDIVCPNCMSTNVSYGPQTSKINWWQLLLSVFFTLPAPVPKKGYHCHRCGHEFNIE